MSAQLGLSFAAPPDRVRLGKQQRVVETFMTRNAGAWFTLAELALAVGAPEASVSARLRTMRARGFTVDRKRSRNGSGLWFYRVRP